MSNDKNLPHDRLFKRIMANEIPARDLLEEYLPNDLKKIIDLSKIKVENKFHRTFTIENITINIKRTSNNKTFKLFKLIPIQNSAYFDFSIRINEDPLILPKFYAALTSLVGMSDNRYDDYKGSYSFAFELEVEKNGNITEYCYHIHHYRSYIEFDTYLIVPKNDRRNSRHYIQPNDELFSDKDISLFSTFLYYYALVEMIKNKYTPQPFVKFSDSNFLLFGYLQNEFFFENYEDQEIYLEAKNTKNQLLDS